MSWNPIHTAPRVDGVYYLGYDQDSAKAHGSPQAGVCIIMWIEPDGWSVQPFSEGLDCIISGYELTHWMPLPDAPMPELPDDELLSLVVKQVRKAEP